ncbi:MAG TPA: Ig-like domain repeat protein, partial [Terracidiphilus sp.]|nr:Ig-like domain repeat protein [Terracidiphilus sp.]
MRPVPLTHLLLPFTLLLTLGRMDAQTVNFDDRSVTQPVTERIGLNLGAINYYDTGQVLRNLVGSLNPGFEPLISQQIWVLDASGTTTSFTIPSIYYAGPENYWTGGTLTVVASQSRGAELGCTSTILTSGGADYPNEPMVTLAAPCAAPLAAGDVVVLRNVASPTPESWWESGDGGFSPTSSNGGKLTSDTTDLCSSCGAQALQMDATASGSTAAATWYFDAAPTENVFVLMNGTFEISFWAKAASQSPTMTVTAQRFSTADFSCGPYTVTPGNAWTQYTYDCTASEQAGTVVPAIAYLSISVTGGAVDLDNLSFQKAQDDQNPTVLRDEVLATLKRFYAISSGGNPGPFRYWLEQNAETLQNWTQPDFAHAPTVAGDNYYVGPNGGGQMQLSLEDYLVICQAIGAEPYLEVPVTFSAADASGLIDFLAASTNTPYGAQRSALGQVQPWASVFKTIHLSFCNECWNTIFSGQNLPYRAGAPAGEALYDYSIVAKTIFSAMRANPAFSSSSFDLIMNAQTAVNYGMDAAIQRVGPDSIELSDYMYGSVSDFGTDTALWTAAMVEPWDTVADASDPSNFYQSVHDYQAQNTCGANGDSPCQIDLYEWGPGTQAGSIDQQHLDFITAGAGQGVVSALQGLLHLQSYGIVNQSYFALAGFENSGPNTELAKLWGNTVDMGGATNNVRPQFLTLSLVNQSIIGPMYSCPIAGNASLNFQGETNNGAIVPPGSPELNDVPLLYAFCFENGNNRSVVFINTDLTTAHTLTFAGTDAPAGVVTMRQFAPASLDALNEAPTGQPSNATPATVAVNTSTLSSLSGLSLPPYSVTALDYTVALPGPGFSLPAGTYSPNQTVTLSDPVGGTTIYYTTDGSTPTTSSAVYSSPITVASTETISAIAVSSTLTSSVSTAHYTIFPAPSAPQFSISSGSYSYGQTVTISDSTTGTVIYYTTDGSPPTTASALYTGPITLTSIPSETLSAIAVANTLSSPVTSAQFTVSKAKASLYFYPSEPVTSGDGAYFLVETSSSPTPTGAITISINGQTFQSSNQWYQGEVALYETSATTAAGWVVGNNTVTASFAGDNIYAPQTMTATVAFSLIPTTTTLTASNTAPLAGSSVQLTAAIYPSAATGAVTFLDGTTTLGTANLTGGVASYTIPAIAAGTHLYSAVYEGNTNDATSTSSAISVNALLSSSTMLAASAMSPLAGTNVTLTATTAPSAATGTVTFMDGSATLGTASLSNGTASYTVYAILAGTHAYTATYGGSATYTSSTSSAVSVTAQPAAAIFTLGVTNPVTYGNSSTFTLASSQYPAPTGSVTFSVNGVALPATKAWANGQISMSVSSSTQANGWIAGSSNTVTAAFAGDSTYAAQTVTQMGVVFQLLSSTTTLSASNPAPEAGSSVVLTAATAPSAATGTVTFLDGNTTLGNGNLVNGAATWTISAITAGPHAFTAVYAGSSAYSTSTSPTLAVSALIGTTTAISTASTSALTNSSVTLTATTSPSVGTGTVTFLDGTAALGTAALNGGIATYTISAIAAGTHNFTAVYGGSSTYAASTSAPVTVTASNTGAWLSSTFNEFASGHALNGTAPAIDDAGTNWSDPNGDWTYTAGGGITASGSDILYPALINTGQSNYAATFTYPAVGAQLLFRYADPSDYLSVQVYSFGEIGLFATVAGTRTSLAALWPGTPSAPLTVTLNGSTATLTCVDQTVTATIPSTPLSGTELGFFAPSAGFVLSSINVTAIGQTQTTSTTTTLTASNSSPQAGASVTLTATTAPSAATGTVTFLDGTTTLGSASLA